VVTDPGAAPMTDLAGQADPVRTLGDHRDAMTAGAQALDGARAQIVAGPGAAQIQPTRLDDKLAVPAAQAAGPMPELPTVEGMTKLVQWNLPGNAQAAFDQAARPKMEGSLTQARAQVTRAETARDADRSKAVTDAQDRVAQAHADADQQQQAKVAESRVRITNQQADALVKHEAEVKKLDVAAGSQKTATITRINDRIAADQNKVDADFKDAQKRAADRKVQGEADAAKKKQDAQDQAANQSWWDQLVGAIGDAIQSIADEITRVLDDIATAIGQILEEVKTAACQLIDAARDFVCQALGEFGDWLKSQVDALIGAVFPELAAALDALIDQAVRDAQAAVTQIADDLEAGVTALCDGLAAAIDGVIAAFKAAVQAAATFAHALLTGDWAAVARMVLDGILTALGIDPAAFYALVGQAQDSLEKIVADPGAFVNHLVDAVKLGFQQFGDNFWTHLQAGLVEWLTGTLSGAGIAMPAALDLGGIFNLTCQVLGLTWPRLRLKVVDLIGEQNTERLEFVASYVEPLLTGGFAGLWEKIQQDLGNLWEMVVGGIRDWLVHNVVQQAVVKIATMWNPAGAIFQLIQTAWNAYQWLRENAQRIFGLVQAVVTSISSIVAGDISGAANFVEDSLARLVPVAISLLADLLGLGGIAEQIKTIIGEVQAEVDRAIDALIQRVMALFQGGGEADGAEAPGEAELHAEHGFTGAEHAHRILTDAAPGGAPRVVICSDPLDAGALLTRVESVQSVLEPADATRVAPMVATARTQLTELEAAARAATRASDTGEGGGDHADVDAKLSALGDTVGQLLDLFHRDGLLIADLGWQASGEELRLLVHEVVDEMLQLPAVQRAVAALRSAPSNQVPVTAGEGMIALGEGLDQRPDPGWLGRTTYVMPDTTVANERRMNTQVVLRGGTNRGDNYAAVVQNMNSLITDLRRQPGYETIGQPQVALMLQSYVTTGELPDDLPAGAIARLNETTLLLFGREAARNRGMTAFTPMSLDLIASGDHTFETMFDDPGAAFGGGANPMSFRAGRDPSHAGPVRAATLDEQERAGGAATTVPRERRAIEELVAREIALAEAWLRSKAPTAWTTNIFESRDGAKQYVRDQLFEYYGVDGAKLAEDLGDAT
jgi:hypothetical protein